MIGLRVEGVKRGGMGLGLRMLVQALEINVVPYLVPLYASAEYPGGTGAGKEEERGRGGGAGRGGCTTAATLVVC